MVAGVALNLVTLSFKTRTWAVPGRCCHVPCTSLYKPCSRSCKPTKPTQVARYAMMSIVWTLLLPALAFAVMPPVPVSESAGAPGRADAAGRVPRFVCTHCSSSGMLSSSGLFLHRAAVLRHISASPACRAAKAGIRTIQVEARAGDVMAGAGGAAGPAPDVRHQPPGDVLPAMQIQTY